MANKQITFELVGKGWDDQRRRLDSILKQLDLFKKSGQDISKVFSGISASGAGTTGFAKFTRDVLASSKTLEGLSKSAKEVAKSFGDQTFKAGQDNLKRSLQDNAASIEKIVKGLKEVQKGTAEAIKLEDQFVEALTKHANIQNQIAKSGWRGAADTVTGGKFGQVMEMLETPAGVFGVGGLAGAAGYRAATYMAQKSAEQIQIKAENRATIADFYAKRAIESFTGNATKEVFLRNLGMQRYADDYSSKMTWRSLAAQGRFGAAAGMQSRGGAVATDVLGGGGIGAAAGLIGGLVAAPFTLGASLGAIPMLMAGGAAIGAGLGGVRSAFEDPVEMRKQMATQQMLTGRELFKPTKEVESYALEYYMSRLPVATQMQRMLGGGKYGLYGPGSMGVEGVYGEGLRAGYAPERTKRTILDMAGIAGARGTGWGGSTRAMDIARYTGVEGAGKMLAQTELLTGFEAGGQADKLTNVIAAGFVKGLDKGDMKIEREAYADAVMYAVSKMGSKGQISGTAALDMASTMLSMLPQNPNLMDIRSAQSGMDLMGDVTTGKTSRIVSSLNIANTMRLAKGFKGPRDMSFIADIEALAAMPVQERTFSNMGLVSIAKKRFGLTDADAADLQDSKMLSDDDLTKGEYSKALDRDNPNLKKAILFQREFQKRGAMAPFVLGGGFEEAKGLADEILSGKFKGDDLKSRLESIGRAGLLTAGGADSRARAKEVLGLVGLAEGRKFDFSKRSPKDIFTLGEQTGLGKEPGWTQEWVDANSALASQKLAEQFEGKAQEAMKEAGGSPERFLTQVNAGDFKGLADSLENSLSRIASALSKLDGVASTKAGTEPYKMSEPPKKPTSVGGSGSPSTPADTKFKGHTL